MLVVRVSGYFNFLSLWHLMLFISKVSGYFNFLSLCKNNWKHTQFLCIREHFWLGKLSISCLFLQENE
uniref:Ovule protein n=1 Tax=Meloidogyne incognita TaxID=6306 RepID=A0A914KQS7_MELIC